MPLKISELSAEDRARLVTLGGYPFVFLGSFGLGDPRWGIIATHDGISLNAGESPLWFIARVRDDGTVMCGSDTLFDHRIILPARKIERMVWLHVWPAGTNGGSAAYDRHDIAPSMKVLAKVCIDLSEVCEGEGIDGNVSEFKLVRVKRD